MLVASKTEPGKRTNRKQWAGRFAHASAENGSPLLARLPPGIPDLDPLKPPQQALNVIGQFLMRGVARAPSQRLAPTRFRNTILANCGYLGLGCMDDAFDLAKHAGRSGTSVGETSPSWRQSRRPAGRGLQAERALPNGVPKKCTVSCSNVVPLRRA
jgi:hypothetical protein